MLYTLGHSNHSAGKFLELLRQHGIEAVADVRSQPVSRFSPHFRKRELERLLAEHGIAYVWLPGLGGRPQDPALRDAAGRPDYARMAASAAFGEGLEALKKLASGRRVAVLCSEEDPNRCHRRLLVVKALTGENPALAAEIYHIRKDGSAQAEAELARFDPPPGLW
ncbi:hypothetical protein Mterra_02637 [Calidithermus terrae]|uniref:DUF488 domain-containing protein n=1 Tax=Calidithermus terrae TaxID=1408545 RepID=A0A399ECV7_9DEIN|nr:DUF488 domain-containing protein [Calidithermus terrae]RIH82474.1 hypothetical protein Mterra_02637 [Calidithermus terrae]